MAQCKWCGAPQAAHQEKQVEWGGSWAIKLVGDDGHLFEPLAFPLKGTTGMPISRPMVPGDFKMFNELKTADLTTLDLEKLVGLAAFGAAYRDAGEHLDVPCRWIEKRLEAIHTAIKSKKAAEIEKELEAISVEENKLKTDEERKQELAARRRTLETALETARRGKPITEAVPTT